MYISSLQERALISVTSFVHLHHCSSIRTVASNTLPSSSHIQSDRTSKIHPCYSSPNSSFSTLAEESTTIATQLSLTLSQRWGWECGMLKLQCCRLSLLTAYQLLCCRPQLLPRHHGRRHRELPSPKASMGLALPSKSQALEPLPVFDIENVSAPLQRE